MTVWKFVHALTDFQELAVPEGTKFIHAAEQLGELTLWGLVDPRAPSELRTIAIVGTGRIAPSESEARHIGTVLATNGFVWHIFEPQEDY